MITRFAVLPDERGLLLGIDKNGMFEAGCVYEAFNIDGTIILKKMGKYALPAQGSFPCALSEPNAIIYHGLHLITDKELANVREQRQSAIESSNDDREEDKLIRYMD